MKSLLMRNPIIIGISWIAIYLGIILLPLLALLLYPPTTERTPFFYRF